MSLTAVFSASRLGHKWACFALVLKNLNGNSPLTTRVSPFPKSYQLFEIFQERTGIHNSVSVLSLEFKNTLSHTCLNSICQKKKKNPDC